VVMHAVGFLGLWWGTGRSPVFGLRRTWVRMSFGLAAWAAVWRWGRG
jgi:hypothetical protein